MGKTFADMSEHERRMNRERIRRGWPADYEADEHDRQTPESIARDREHREAARQREIERAARRRGLKGRN